MCNRATPHSLQEPLDLGGVSITMRLFSEQAMGVAHMRLQTNAEDEARMVANMPIALGPECLRRFGEIVALQSGRPSDGPIDCSGQDSRREG